MGNTSWSGTRTPLPKTTRSRIKRRDRWTCQKCGGAICGNRDLQVDHRIPVAEGGGDDDANLWTLGDDCHRQKTRAERQRGIQRRSPRRKADPHPGLR